LRADRELDAPEATFPARKLQQRNAQSGPGLPALNWRLHRGGIYTKWLLARKRHFEAVELW